MKSMTLNGASENPLAVQSIEAARRDCLKRILEEDKLHVVFQPIVDIRLGSIIGYEGLSRGPLGSALTAPVDLFRVAGENGLTVELETLCCRRQLEQFSALKLSGKLFLNISSGALPHISQGAASLVRSLENIGLSPGQVVFELTEQPAHDPHQLVQLLAAYRAAGFQLALDDMGTGSSNLLRWYDSRPDYVKIDMRFIQGIHHAPLKQRMLRSLQDIALESGAELIAEGVEQPAELEFLVAAGVQAGQGYYFARPEPQPDTVLSERLISELRGYKKTDKTLLPPEATAAANAGTLLRETPCASPSMSNNGVCELFNAHPELQSIPIVDGTTPIGMLLRDDLIGRFARPYQRELYGRRSCTLFMERHPPIVDQSTSLQQLGHILMDTEHARLINDFIITVDGRYRGIGTSYDLLRELTAVQITAAKHANPLTQLPGNVPINLHIEGLLKSGVPFCACYVDLDNFKPFNDVFGFAQGDEIIQMTGRVLGTHACDGDFVGHIGGDDFLVLWRSPDWEVRCNELLKAFGESVRIYLHDSGIMHTATEEGYCAYDRNGNQRLYQWPSVSLGIITVDACQYENYHQIAGAAAEAKALAKKISGNSMHIERRAGTSRIRDLPATEKRADSL